jgi:MYXO-CTERM domain-containing protein
MKKAVVLRIVPSLGLAALLAAGPAAFAQAPGECSSGFCGTPDMSGGGGGGGGGGGAILIANTDIGETYSTSDDFDQDGYEDDLDNCPFVANTGQIDRDGDSVGDVCDNAPDVPNRDQLDSDGDGIGNVADDDMDGDGILNAVDNCALVPNPTQNDTNTDALGDACDPDDDGDGIPDIEDQCPKLPGQVDPSTQGCRGDEDLDGIDDAFDNCAGTFNDDQTDVDGDGLGDLCDVDIDGDSILNNLDNAPYVANPDQIDRDRDGLGDVADPEFCYVFSRANPSACLNPLDTFKVGAVATAIGEAQRVQVGDPVTFLLYANRVDVPIEYSWVVERRPEGSDATIANAAGKVVSSLGGYEYKYQKSGFVAPKLVPDASGEYSVRLEARLVFEDEVFPGGAKIATHSMALMVEGEQAAGCSTTQSQPTGLVGLLLGALGLVFRRRRR